MSEENQPKMPDSRVEALDIDGKSQQIPCPIAQILKERFRIDLLHV
jgi:hypothetical protein